MLNFRCIMKRPGKMPTSTQTQVLLILFPGFNTLDMNGPYDVFTKSGTSQYFSVTIAAEDDITKSFEGVLVQVGMTFLVARNFQNEA